jgi:TolA-binding protein
MKKRTQLKTALLLAATVNVSYAAEVCFPPAEGTPFYDVLQCFQNGLDAQQKRVAALETENQRLRTLVSSSKTQIDSQQKRIAALEKENQRLRTLVSSSKTQIDSQQKRIAALETENQRLRTLVSSSKTQIDSQQKRIAALEKETQRFQALRYVDNGNGTVTDTRTELIWLKNANCFGRQSWYTAMRSAANLRIGQCGLSDGSIAGMWRLPTRSELAAMVDKRYQYPTLSNAAGTAQWKEGDTFSGVQSDNYWSSTESANDSDGAWVVYLLYGSVGTNGKTLTHYVWPVRRRR